MSHKFYKNIGNGDMVELSAIEYILFSGNTFKIPLFLSIPFIICIVIILIDALLI